MKGRKIMMKKRLSAIAVLLILALILTACNQNAGAPVPPQNTTEPSQSSGAQQGTVDAAEYPVLDFDPKEVFSVGPHGEVAAPASAVENFTDEELQKLKDGNYTCVISYSQTKDQSMSAKMASDIARLQELGIKVVAATDANSSIETQVSQLETGLALNPDALIVHIIDAVAEAAIVNEYAQRGIKIVMSENLVEGQSTDDYVTCISSDIYGNGRAAAIMLADAINYEGKVGMVFWDYNYFQTNERDRGFKETIQAYYPNIEIVESGFGDFSTEGSQAAAGLFANNPDLKGVYASWDTVANEVMAQAKSFGLTDLKIVTVDYSDDSVKSILTGDLIYGTASPRVHLAGITDANAVAYSLLGKDVPKFIATPTLPVLKNNALEAYTLTYGIEPLDWMIELAKAG